MRNSERGEFDQRINNFIISFGEGLARRNVACLLSGRTSVDIILTTRDRCTMNGVAFCVSVFPMKMIKTKAKNFVA